MLHLLFFFSTQRGQPSLGPLVPGTHTPTQLPSPFP